MRTSVPSVPRVPGVLAAALSLICGGLAAQPAGMQARVGSATLSQQGSTLVVATRNGAAGYSALDWQRFSIPSGSAVRFEQPSATSTAINRVTGGDPSSLMGSLSSNGRLVLVNPAGITVGAGAVVDTAGFTASTVNASDADLLSGRFATSRDLAGPAADLAVEGRILARHGDVVLVGGNVRHAGAIEALGAALEGGRVVLRALGEARVAGEVVARREPAATETGSDTAVEGAVGGAIGVFGARVVLEPTARLDASGAAGGGVVRVGGDFQGANPEVPNAGATEMAAGARISADATDRGDGGRVVLWSDGRTVSAGRISARGGPQGGDGGFVEFSGQRQLVFSSRVDAGAPQGRVGRLLLDPNDIELIAGDTPLGQTGAVTQVGTHDLLASNADVTLQTTGSITVTDPVTWSQPTQLTLQARIDLVVHAPITPTGGGSVRLVADGLMVPSDPLVGPSTLRIQAPVTAAAISLYAAGDTGSGIALQGAELLATSGALSLTGPAITLAGSNRLWGAGGTSVTGAMRLDPGATLRSTGQAADGALLPGQLVIAGSLTLAAGSTLRMALGKGGQDEIRLGTGSSASFGDNTRLVLDLLPGVRRLPVGKHTLVVGTAGGTLPTVGGAGASAGARVRWGSLEVEVPEPDPGALMAFVTTAPVPAPRVGEASVGKPLAPASGPVAYEDPALDCP